MRSRSITHRERARLGAHLSELQPRQRVRVGVLLQSEPQHFPTLSRQAAQTLTFPPKDALAAAADCDVNTDLAVHDDLFLTQSIFSLSTAVINSYRLFDGQSTEKVVSNSRLCSEVRLQVQQMTEDNQQHFA